MMPQDNKSLSLNNKNNGKNEKNDGNAVKLCNRCTKFKEKVAFESKWKHKKIETQFRT